MKKGLYAALGDFDGVHSGHLSVIRTVIDSCENLIPSVYTFADNCKNAPILTDNEQKESILKSLGIEKVIFDDFNTIKDLTPEQFVSDILLKKYNIKAIVCGSDFKFGKNAVGDVKTLEKLCSIYGISLNVVDCLYFENKKISSSTIRYLIETGEIEKANMLMNRHFCVSGTVKRGKSLAHKHNAPTINIDLKTNSVIPRYGVYITRTTIGTKQFNSITNVGVRPSVETTDTPNIETNIFNFHDDIYNQNVKIEFLKMIRPEIKFENSDKLFEQIKKDIVTAKKYFIGDNNV